MDPHRIPEMLRELARRAPKGKRGTFERLLAETQPILAYMERQTEIEAASKALEAHRGDFEKLANDGQEYQQQSHALFAEERFAPLRFTADEVRRAFDQVGQPPNMAADDRFVEKLRATILHLATKERRSQLAMSLLLHLPDYVAAGRPLDACILQECAYLTSDAPGDSNPFLFQMFSHGYDAWAAEQRARDEALLREVGIDLPRLEGMSLDEIDALLREQQANPAVLARMEAMMQAHPEQQARAAANFEEMQRNSVSLLEREDAAGLLLSPEDFLPWMPRLNECMAGIVATFPVSSDSVPDPSAGDTLASALWPIIGEMAGAIFTAERRQQLLVQLKTYRNELFASGDKRLAGYAQSAMTSIEREDEPAKNFFLNALCFASLLRFSKTLSGSEEDHQ